MPSLRSRLEELLVSPQTVACRCQMAARYAAERYSWERVADAHEALYYQVARL